MAIDDLIANGVRPPAIDPPGTAMGRALTLGGLVQQQQMGALHLQQARQAIQDEQDTRAIYRNAFGSGQQPGGAAGPVYDPSAIVNQLRARGLHTQADAVMKSALDAREKLAQSSKNEQEAGHFNAQTAKMHSEAVGQALNALRQLPEDQQAANYPAVRAQLIQQGHVSPAEAPEQFPGAAWINQHADQVLKADQLLEMHIKQAEEKRKAALAPSQLAASEAEATQKSITAEQYKALGMTKDQFEQLSETKKRDTVNAAVARGRLSVAQGELALRKKTFDLTLGAGLDATGQPKLGDDGKPIVNPLAAAIANYQMPPIAARAMASPQGAMLMKQVLAVNPDYQATNFQAFQKTENDATTGHIATSANALNTMMGHLVVLNKAAGALKNGSLTDLNKLANTLGLHTGQSAPAVYKTIVHRVGPEVTKAYLASGGSVGERGTNEEDFSENASPEQMQGSVGVSALLADSKVKALQDQYQRGTYGRGKQKLLSDEAEKARQELTRLAPKDLQGAGGAAAAPGGHTVGETRQHLGATYKFDGKQWVKQ